MEPARHFENGKNHIGKFWEEHPDLDPNELIEIDGEHRCGWCNQNFKLASGLQSHLREPQSLAKGTKAAKAVKRSKLAKLLYKTMKKL